ncbi:MAG TPA: bifunctional 4-hydroxy-2-oxoglutarate aldolase/2-dehydro-3-deoxy-phosphogluconate aldolase [Virgibacillus sp.]|nr:bifunctional 4-hydroxy-2-oxoglutarate aldolase/2-dehydro-3-deoxy-phosphogluconate aldolase [Virgibacillus sp.]HLR69363.1 bifunctional 4-hydroxy-2-oxoglutarate aldolase/2-dehydro-3-deoxy-phosphogluconate aldolase [Virgibacillus sp.]
MDKLEQLKKLKVVAVVRNANKDNIIPICQSLAEGGIEAVEITAETPNVTTMLKKAIENHQDNLLIGAGTVLDNETARNVIMAGAEFVVSPTFNEDTIKMTKRYGIISIPGALTPTEILTAYENGADLVKVFPANVFGANYIKTIHGPMPQIPLMVTGGVNQTNISDYIQAGAYAVGIGSDLVNPSNLKSENDYLQLTETTRKYVDKVNSVIE